MFSDLARPNTHTISLDSITILALTDSRHTQKNSLFYLDTAYHKPADIHTAIVNNRKVLLIKFVEIPCKISPRAYLAFYAKNEAEL